MSSADMSNAACEAPGQSEPQISRIETAYGHALRVKKEMSRRVKI